MRCIHPRIIPNKNPKNYDQLYITVSCGKCYPCLSNRRRSWLFRLVQEASYSFHTVFCSLTIDPAFIRDGLIHKEDLQLYFKRLRHEFDFKYYAIGEYGTTTRRPHYHAVLFIKSPFSDLQSLFELLSYQWSLGFSSFSRAKIRRLNYVLHYHTRPKKINGNPTFQLYSKGLGKDFMNHDFVNWYRQTNKNIVHDFEGNVFVIPRYYRKKLQEMMIATPQGLSTFIDEDTGEVFTGFDIDNYFYKNFNKHVWEMSDQQKISFLQDVAYRDSLKLSKYNSQDKFV